MARAREGGGCLGLKDPEASSESMRDLEVSEAGVGLWMSGWYRSVHSRRMDPCPHRRLTMALPSPPGCRCTLRWPPTRFMATLPGLCCWWLSLWVSLQGKLDQFGAGDKLPEVIPGLLPSSIS